MLASLNKVELFLRLGNGQNSGQEKLKQEKEKNMG